MHADISQRYFRIAQELKRAKRKRPRLTETDIQADVKLFLSRGGRIQQLEMGDTGQKDLKDGYRNCSRFTQAERDQHRKR